MLRVVTLFAVLAIIFTRIYCANWISVYFLDSKNVDRSGESYVTKRPVTTILTPNPPCKKPEISAKIAGGVNVTELRFPYMVSIRNNSDKRHLCAGTLLTPQHVLTAAHCLEDFSSPDEYYVVCGTVFYSGAGGVTRQVEDLQVPDEYYGRLNYWQSDLAILKLTEPVEFSKKIQPVQLARSNTTAGKVCFVIGWGSTNATSGDNPMTIQVLTQMTIDELMCKMEYFHVARISKKHVCAVFKMGYSPCNGDGGGPLICSGEQHGIAAFGVQCDLGYPTVYTRITHFLDWIMDRTKKNITL